ncbi:hypothetical protein PPL_05646 [Heterostelium album PN500]|uniref:Glutathione S-transferase n=1 Tax=Heterostelium pallidum (strain ATCC 26659 / Pp 5 / PN500) TaxID=670386 RepID=D3BAR5_HETP5|nr:hypothetical protein PPL_05646 [Heterostelium album PN500]EFA81652.1 hypothetical protein PPL_05646 [Heterostelium album PN500]|eukprot:XP_020433769.1 hypothetical protein PPL_05646 [Heterostelium album PN500]
MSLPTLHYFDIKGRGEGTRLLLAYADVEFVDNRFEFAAYPAEVRAKTMFGQVPHYSDGEVELSQSVAIEMYLAKKYGLYGSTPLDEAMIMSYIMSTHDLFIGFFFAKNGGAEALAKFYNETVPRLVSSWEKALIANGGSHIYGKTMTWADLGLFGTIDYLFSIGEQKMFEGSPACLEFHRQMSEVPTISKYLKTRKVTTR